MSERTPFEPYLVWQGHLTTYEPSAVYRLIRRPKTKDFIVERRNSHPDSLGGYGWVGQTADSVICFVLATVLGDKL